MANGKIKIVSNMSPELSQRPQISGTIAAATGGTTKHDKLSNRTKICSKLEKNFQDLLNLQD